MKKFIKIIRNKYVYTSLFLVFYILILHETDVVTLINRKDRVQDLELEIERKKEEIQELKVPLKFCARKSSFKKSGLLLFNFFIRLFVF